MIKKTILFIVTFIITTSFVFSKGDVEIKKRLNDQEAKLAQLEEQVQELIELSKTLNYELKLKESQFQLYEALLKKYDSSNSSLISEFSIFIAVLSLIFGFVGYFTAFKPAQESKKEVDRLLEKLQTNIDALFSDYLKKNRDKLIVSYLQVLLDKKESEISNAIHYLDSVKHEGFNSEQLFKMRKIVLEDEYRFTHQIFKDMIFTKDEIVENTCTEILKNKIDDVVAYALIYFAEYEIHKNDDLVIEYMNKVPDQWHSKIASIRSASEDYLIKLWDNYHDKLTDESMSNILKTLEHYKEHRINEDSTIAGFLDKVKSSKFGQENKDDKMKFLFLTFKPLF